jgi:hypothetical protein
MRSLRIDRRLVRWCRVTLGGRLKAVTVDLSEFGFCAELGPVFVPGAPIEGTLRVRDRDFHFQGEVTWAQAGRPAEREPSRIGVRFTDIPRDFPQWLHRPLLAAG